MVVPDSSAAQNVPAVDGLLEYRKDEQELYIRSNKTWNVLAPKNKVTYENCVKTYLIEECSHYNFTVILSNRGDGLGQSVLC